MDSNVERVHRRNIGIAESASLYSRYTARIPYSVSSEPELPRRILLGSLVARRRKTIKITRADGIDRAIGRLARNYIRRRRLGELLRAI